MPNASSLEPAQPDQLAINGAALKEQDHMSYAHFSRDEVCTKLKIEYKKRMDTEQRRSAR